MVSRLSFLGLLILVSALVVFLLILSSPFLLRQDQTNLGVTGNSTDYVGNVKLFEVRGSSLAPLINPGETIKLLYGYYDNHPVERGDIVAYDYAGNDVPIIKIVKAIPGDKWRVFQKRSFQAGRFASDSYQIIVNDKPLKNSEGQYYQIPESNIKMLKLYAESYPVLKDDTYLILGNKILGSLDATRFGLVSKSDILGKVEVCR